MRSSILFLSCGVLALSLSACSAFRKPIRPYYEENPTVGGTYPEGGMLGGPDYYDEYRSGRSPAGSTAPAMSENGTWVGPNQEAQEYRDAQRPPTTYAQSRNVDPRTVRQYKNGSRATRADFIDDSQNAASLWASGGQTNYFFTKNKIRSVGDIITLTPEEPLIRSIGIELRKTLDERELEAELEATKMRLKTKALAAKKGEGKTRAPAAKNEGGETAAAEEEEEIEIPDPTFTDIDVTEQMGIKAGEPMMAEIAERFPNGNYKIRVIKKIPYRGQERMMSMLGIVKGSELEESDTVASGKLYEYRIKVFR